jgi:hypothetical protein
MPPAIAAPPPPLAWIAPRILDVLARFGTVEKLGLDEVFLDITAAVGRRLGQLQPGVHAWHGHLHRGGSDGIHQDNPRRPMDLRCSTSQRASHALLQQSEAPTCASGIRVLGFGF